MFAWAAQTLICQDTEYFVSLTKKKKAIISYVMRFGQMRRWHLTATLTTESGAAMCDGLIKQEDYLPVICTCIIYNLLLRLKNSMTLHISLIETASSNCDSISWHRGTQQPTQVTNSSKCNHKSSGNSCLLRLTDGNGADAAMIWASPCCLGLVRLWERQTLCLCITALAPRLQNKRHIHKTISDVTAVYFLYKHIIMKI